MATTVENGSRRLTWWAVGLLWLTPLVLGFGGTVLLRMRIESANDGNLDTGDRIFLLGAAVMVPLSCYLLSALSLAVPSGGRWPRGRRAVLVFLGSALAVALWVLAVS